MATDTAVSEEAQAPIRASIHSQMFGLPGEFRPLVQDPSSALRSHKRQDDNSLQRIYNTADLLYISGPYFTESEPELLRTIVVENIRTASKLAEFEEKQNLPSLSCFEWTRHFLTMES